MQYTRRTRNHQQIQDIPTPRNNATQYNDILYTNVQGLTANIDQLVVLINESKPKVIILTETHITSEFLDAEININGYKVLRCDSNSRHTGVLYYIREQSIECKSSFQ